ncbi:MAG TPA: glycogen debranching protein GlgX [Dehalococcoidia bacterium]|nr:glycogen debranching protein GlgX [Dehalococcoidia bacterium]
MAAGPNLNVRPGRPYPLGATSDAGGANFAVFSENAEFVELCLFNRPAARAETARIRMLEVTAHVHHVYVEGVRPGQLYGYRVHGPYAPEEGHRFNPNKLLIDPYARGLAGGVNWEMPIFGFPPGHARRDLGFCRRNDAHAVPKCVVMADDFVWGDDRPPRTPWRKSVIYEVHVKGFTKLHPDVPPELRGTYAGLHSPAALRHLQQLGVTAVELLPVHAFIDDGFLLDRGLVNYWGYNTINFFTPEGRYACAQDPAGQVREFKQMVKALHAQGIEVILDVVYNHTAEGNEQGPTLSFRGLDNAAYYRLVPEQPRYYLDYTGTGNTLNVPHPQVLKLIMDSLRYWVQEMHVDGFRFDLAASLARELHDVDRLSAFFDVIHQDPVISSVKLIAEPWDVGEGGYQVGNFPVLWTEWNGKYRDTVRRYWKGDAGLISELGYRLSGSSDLYERGGRRPSASINFITCHDGFTLSDLVSYDAKHNEANGEANRDGADHNDSWNCGAEGPTDDAAIRALRARQQRNFLATLLLSQGVPMISAGDEIGRTQQGNNNAYCQDNAISWLHWDLREEQQQLLEWARRLLSFRAEQPVLRRRHFFQGRPIHGTGVEDLAWFRPDGEEMTEQEWVTSFSRSLIVKLNGEALDEIDEEGNTVRGDSLLLLLNAHHEALPFTLPAASPGTVWEIAFDTARPDLAPAACRVCEGGPAIDVEARSLVVLCRSAGEAR